MKRNQFLVFVLCVVIAVSGAVPVAANVPSPQAAGPSAPAIALAPEGTPQGESCYWAGVADESPADWMSGFSLISVSDAPSGGHVYQSAAGAATSYLSVYSLPVPVQATKAWMDFYASRRVGGTTLGARLVDRNRGYVFEPTWPSLGDGVNGQWTRISKWLSASQLAEVKGATSSFTLIASGIWQVDLVGLAYCQPDTATATATATPTATAVPTATPQQYSIELGLLTWPKEQAAAAAQAVPAQPFVRPAGWHAIWLPATCKGPGCLPMTPIGEGSQAAALAAPAAGPICPAEPFRMVPVLLTAARDAITVVGRGGDRVPAPYLVEAGAMAGSATLDLLGFQGAELSQFRSRDAGYWGSDHLWHWYPEVVMAAGTLGYPNFVGGIRGDIPLEVLDMGNRAAVLVKRAKNGLHFDVPSALTVVYNLEGQPKLVAECGDVDPWVAVVPYGFMVWKDPTTGKLGVWVRVFFPTGYPPYWGAEPVLTECLTAQGFEWLKFDATTWALIPSADRSSIDAHIRDQGNPVIPPLNFQPAFNSSALHLRTVQTEGYLLLEVVEYATFTVLFVLVLAL
ncbi:hypothetical protein A2966_04930 [Candidatus Roizmanbacteria bacterium RIFCSPLOWO2_01_FULL_41_22]|uniref:CBM11 domain-containing protein n=1 Tax=Candidatus Roizmanbacteria bacterium RIFCSPLOWO2_01_FULL_41_22 TaxID=1802067 RepID=A0A1F7J7P6_9BACT|nr:MAG: hypothetical protein A2966_04930 [Candidatus Roizmanbacteria bacterium RIFCSPLOWO2_01_FULL_41_22]